MQTMIVSQTAVKCLTELKADENKFLMIFSKSKNVTLVRVQVEDGVIESEEKVTQCKIFENKKCW